MTPDDKRHGTYAGYVAHGKLSETACLACATAATRFRKQARLETHRGTPRVVPLGDHAWQILTSRTPEHLTRHSGVPLSTIFRLRKVGPEVMVRRGTRDALLASHTMPTPIGIQRRLRALTARGWSMRALAAEMGNEFSDNLRVLLARDGVKYVREPMASAIVAAYDRLAMQPPPVGRGPSRARNRAAAEGWVPPLMWDSIDTDPEPAATTPDRHNPDDYDEAMVLRVFNGGTKPRRLTRAETIEVVRRLLASGLSTRQVADRYGIKVERFYRVGDDAA